MRSSFRFVPIVVTLSFAMAATALGETLVALGEVSETGTLLSGYATGGNALTSSRGTNSAGDYFVRVTGSGSFSGADIDDFVVELTPVIGAGSDLDEVIRVGGLSSVNNDELSIRVRVTDAESDGATNGTASDRGFYFLIRRIPSSSVIDSDSGLLKACGIYDINGTQTGVTAVRGVNATLSKVATGYFELTLAGLNPSAPYVVQATVLDDESNDDVVYAEAPVSNGEQTVFFRVRDVNASNDVPFPVDKSFFFTVYCVPAGNPSPPDSKLLTALGIVGADGDAEQLAAIPGLNVLSTKFTSGSPEGFYVVTLTSFPNPGKPFAGLEPEDFVLILTSTGIGHLDEAVRGYILFVEDTTMDIGIFCDDVEDGGTGGVPTDREFHFALYRCSPDRRPDLRTGKKRAPKTHKKDNRYNTSGNGQVVRVTARRRNKKFYFSAENDGNLGEDYRLRGKRPRRGLDLKFFLLGGKRKNITAAVRRKGYRIRNVLPGEIVKIQGQARAKGRSRQTIRFQLISLSEAGKKDVNKGKFRTLPR